MEQVLKEFASLNRIPRPSKHEEAVAEYLVERSKELGYHGVRDLSLIHI